MVRPGERAGQGHREQGKLGGLGVDTQRPHRRQPPGAGIHPGPVQAEPGHRPALPVAGDDVGRRRRDLGDDRVAERSPAGTGDDYPAAGNDARIDGVEVERGGRGQRQGFGDRDAEENLTARLRRLRPRPRPVGHPMVTW